MADILECEGAPRDLGRDQALAARAALRTAAGGDGAWRRLQDLLGVGDAALSRWRRDTRRYFPHQHEWLEGVAHAAGLPSGSLLRACVAELESQRDAVLIGAEGMGLWRSPAPGAVLRRVRPEGRFESVEWASPLLACPWIGVNQAGLALAVSGGARPGACRAHAALLARDCLERFEGVESALAWCLGRPVAPGAALLLSDATGELAGVELTDSGRNVRRAEAGLLVLCGARATRVAKLLSEAPRDPDGFHAAVARVLPEPGLARVALAERSLCAAGRTAVPGQARP